MDPLESLHGSASPPPQRVTIITVLQELRDEDFRLFKVYLREGKSIPWSHLEDADRVDTSFQIRQSYHDKALDVTMEFLKQMGKSDLVETFSLTGPPDKARFVTQHKARLIQAVSAVMAIVDSLGDAWVHPELYAEIQAQRTSMGQMRMLYSKVLEPGGTGARAAFYHALEQHQPHLLLESHDVSDVGGSSGSCLLAATLQPPQDDWLVKAQGHARPITFYQARLKTNVEDPFASLPEGTIQMTDKEHFKECYTRLRVIHMEVTELSSEHEVTLMDLKNEGLEIQLIEMFEHRFGQSIRIRTVLSIGIAGVGKTFLVHKFVFDWAKNTIQHPHLIFVFQFRQLNLLRGQSFRLAELIHKCINATKCIPEEALNDIFTTLQMSGISNYDKSPFKLLFVLDGLDESSLELNFNVDHDCSDEFAQSTILEVLLVNLIRGKLLSCAHIWITTRPAAAKLIPSALFDIVTEVQGFTDDMKKEYIRKRFTDENQAERIISHIEASSSIYNMCEIPVFCSITVTVLLKIDLKGELPETLTDMYCHFLLVQMRRMKEKYNDAEVNPEELIVAYRAVLLKLGMLAFEHLQKGNLIFNQKDLEKCDLDIKEGPLYSGVCTEIFKRDGDCFQETVYCFVHLSIQEFLAAVYLFHCFTERKMEVLETFLDDRSYFQKLLPKFMSHFQLRSMDDFLKKAMLKAMKSENGHLDLFVRFLHGLSLETNQRLLQFLLGHTENSPSSIQRAIRNLKEMNTADASPDSCITIFQCLMEMKDQSVEQEIRKYLSSEKWSKKEHLVKGLNSLRTDDKDIDAYEYEIRQIVRMLLNIGEEMKEKLSAVN